MTYRQHALGETTQPAVWSARPTPYAIGSGKQLAQAHSEECADAVIFLGIGGACKEPR